MPFGNQKPVLHKDFSVHPNTGVDLDRTPGLTKVNHYSYRGQES